MSTNDDLTEDATLLVSWALRIRLQELAAAGDDFARQMVCSGEPYDLLRPEACALPRRGGSRVGLIVQPYDWALALAILDLSVRRREGMDRPCAHKGSVTALEMVRVASEIEDEASSFVESATRCLTFRSEESMHTTMGCSPVLPLYGACEVCSTSALKCHGFSSTPHRPELCMCVHGASYHACVDPRTTPNVSMRHSDHSDFVRRSEKGAALAPVSRTQSTSTRWDLAAADLLRHCSFFLSSIGNAGIRDLLGLKRTAGSMENRLPPPRCILLEALNKPHASAPALVVKARRTTLPTSGRYGLADEESRMPVHPDGWTKRQRDTIVCNLSAGGRALCKHAVRSMSSWWGGCGGTESDKNQQAYKAVLRVLAGATWVNIHVFGGGGVDGVFEVREESGYGARWSADGVIFRGFLEPHMDHGHEKGWRH